MEKQVFDDGQHILGKLELVDLVRWQINRCNVSAGDELLFSRNVEMLKNMLPSESLREIEELKLQYTDVVEMYVFKFKGGRKLGSIERPFFINTPEDPNYDGGERVLISPVKRKIETKNYDKLYTVVLRMLEIAGLTWKHEIIQIEGGKVDFDDEPQVDTPTPTFEEDEKK